MKSLRVQLSLRVSEQLDAKLTTAAEAMGVSKNAYIVMLLSDGTSKKEEAEWQLQR